MAAAPESAGTGKGLIGWIDERFPLTKLWKEQVAEYYAPKNFNFWYFFGALSLVVLVNQLVTGIFLTMSYKPSSAEAFASVQYIMRDVEWGWLIRYLHTTGASAFFIVVYLHMFRALLYGSHRKPRELVWIFGCLIFILLMAEAFMGYVLPWGNMSYWGAQVIVSLFSSLPIIGGTLVEWIRGDYNIADPTLNRFFALHVAALPLALVFLVVAHLMALHEVGSNNPDGIDIKKYKDDKGHPLDGVPFHPYYTVKDTLGLAGFLLIFAAVIFFAPTFFGESAANTPRHHAGVVFHAVLRHVARRTLRLRHTGVGSHGDGRRHRGAVLRPMAGSLPGALDTLQGAHLQSDVGGLFRLLRHLGGMRHEAALGHLPDVGENLHRFVLRVLLVDALVHEIRQREAGAGKGYGTCLKPAF
jgi:quinol-cytochrome oxidoreductase complex cytochrome b subunit